MSTSGMHSADASNPDASIHDDGEIDLRTGEKKAPGGESDPFHDFSIPQDADLVAAPTPNEDEAPGKPADDDPVGSAS